MYGLNGLALGYLFQGLAALGLVDHRTICIASHGTIAFSTKPTEFRAQCGQCHGSGAAGAIGYQNFLDNDWFWGGSLEDIAFSVLHGIRNETDADACYIEMPPFGDILESADIETLVSFVPTLADADWESPGGVFFNENCAYCHGDQRLGDHSQGAPQHLKRALSGKKEFCEYPVGKIHPHY